MNSQRDQDLLAFLLGELPVLKRLDVRARLIFSRNARNRLAELERAADAISGAIGAGGVAAFRANSRVRLHRLILLDLAVFTTLIFSVGLGSIVIWRTLHPSSIPDGCVVPGTNQVIPEPAVRAGSKPPSLPRVQARR